MSLTDTACRNVRAGERAKKISDSGGLHLLISPNGSKLWRLAYRFGGKQKTLALGAYPTVSLLEARRGRDAAKEQLSRGNDPASIKQHAKKEAKLAATNHFEGVAREWFAARKQSWVPSYSGRLMRRLEADIFPSIGSRPINSIEPPELLSTIRVIERRDAVELAKRLLQTVGQIFRFAIATGRARRDPTQDLRGALQSAGPRKHRAALKAVELPKFLNAVEQYEGEASTRLGLKLLMHTMVRSSEARFALWSEFEDLDGATPIWRIPAERMKMRTEHLIPISPQVVRLLKELKALNGASDYLFPSPAKKGVISENTWIYAIYRLGYHSRMTVHGFRGTASTILNEHGFNRDWIERQLAHTDRDSVRAAYNAAEWLSDRRQMMCWWSTYLDSAQEQMFAHII
jgi:integrase